MWVVPSISDAMPTPEPPPCTEMSTPGCLSMKTSAPICTTGSTVVEPLIVSAFLASVSEHERASTRTIDARKR